MTSQSCKLGEAPIEAHADRTKAVTTVHMNRLCTEWSTADRQGIQCSWQTNRLTDALTCVPSVCGRLFGFLAVALHGRSHSSLAQASCIGNAHKHGQAAKQTNKHTNKQTDKQTPTNSQANKRPNKQLSNQTSNTNTQQIHQTHISNPTSRRIDCAPSEQPQG